MFPEADQRRGAPTLKISCRNRYVLLRSKNDKRSYTRYLEHHSLHASPMSNRAPQQLRRERGRALLEEAGLGAPELLDPSILWADVEATFVEHDRRRATAGAALANLEFLTEVASAARQLHDVLAMGASHQRRGGCGALEARLKTAGDASAAACTALHSPEFLLALVAAARAAAHDLKGHRSTERSLSGRQDELENGWLLADGLPEVFSRHTGLKAELTPVNEEHSAPTACMRFLKAAFELSGRELLSDADVLTTVARWRRGQRAKALSGQEAQASTIAPPNRVGGRETSGEVGRDGTGRRRSAITRLFNRGSGKTRPGVTQ